LWPRSDGCAVAVAPAVWRNWAAIRLALGRIYSDFRNYPEIMTFIHSIAEVVRMQRRRFQQVLESTMFRSIAQLLERNNTRHLGPAGGAFANARLNRLLSDKLPIDEIFIYPAMGDDGRPTGGALCYLLQQYISPALVALS
jgi:carbamoyltransferase